MKTIDKKYFKCFRERPTDFELEYIPFYPKEQKERYIKIMRGKIRESERTEKRICNFLNTQVYV